MPQSPNRILNALPQNIFAAMEPHLRNVTLAFADVVAETGNPVRNVYFPLPVSYRSSSKCKWAR
jgi:hypothetical protein